MTFDQMIAEADRRGTRIFPMRSLRAETLAMTVTCFPVELLHERLEEIVARLQDLGWG